MLYYLGWIIFYLIIRASVGIFAGLRVEGLENVPRTGALIITPNHISFSDPPIVEAVIKRHSWFMATNELFEMKILGPLARLMRGFPIKQDSPDRAALRKTEELLKRGESVVVFPEGHVSKDGRLQPIQHGTIMVALRTGAPLLPVGLLNTDKFMPPHTFKFRRSPSPIVVRIGKPIPVEELSGGMKGRAAIENGAALLRKVLLELTGASGDAATDSIRPDEPISADVLPEAAAHLHAATLAEYSRGV